jgi:hypothetical protein
MLKTVCTGQDNIQNGGREAENCNERTNSRRIRRRKRGEGDSAGREYGGFN